LVVTTYTIHLPQDSYLSKSEQGLNIGPTHSPGRREAAKLSTEILDQFLEFVSKRQVVAFKFAYTHASSFLISVLVGVLLSLYVSGVVGKVFCKAPTVSTSRMVSMSFVICFVFVVILFPGEASDTGSIRSTESFDTVTAFTSDYASLLETIGLVSIKTYNQLKV
jgi:hypothetical protein